MIKVDLVRGKFVELLTKSPCDLKELRLLLIIPVSGAKPSFLRNLSWVPFTSSKNVEFATYGTPEPTIRIGSSPKVTCLGIKDAFFGKTGLNSSWERIMLSLLSLIS